MAKYLVETFYTCTFKVSHYLDKIDEKELENLEKKEDGKFEILDMKIDNRKTKNLDKNLKTVDNLSDKEKQINKVDKIDDNKKTNNNFVKNLNETVNKRFGMHFLSCTVARLVLQSPFMTKRLLKIASVDKNTINFVVELLFDEARLTIKETFSLALKFILPFKTVRFFSKSPAFSL